MSRTEIEAKSLDFTLATCGAEVCFWPVSVAAVTRLGVGYWGQTSRTSFGSARRFLTDTVEKGVALIGEQ
jgi:hypothetical protein